MAWRLTQKAADDLVGIYLDGLERFGASQADIYHVQLETIFEFLARISSRSASS